MEFSSMLFLWAALPAICLLTALVRRTRLQNALLLLISLLFYAWGDPDHLVLLLVMIAVNYLFGLALERTGAARAVLVLAVLCNLGVLGVFKYADFVLGAADWILPGGFAGVGAGRLADRIAQGGTGIVQPLGISFFTFQALTYVIDLYRGRVRAQKNPAKLALYLAFFPRIVSGPIEPYMHAEAQLTTRAVTRVEFAEGFRRFLYGLGKKAILSDLIAMSVDRIFAVPAQLNGPSAWLGSALYALQLYYDFSGYSDMAIGLGRMLGFTIPENFRYPYLSGSVTEFWRRWHITLGAFFRDYLYIPLGGSRRGKRRTICNLMIVFALTGLWHGAGLAFVLWGLWHGMFISLERLGLRKFLDRHRVFGVIYTNLVWIVSMALFRTGSISAGAETLSCMFLPFLHRDAQPLMASYFTVQSLSAIVLGVTGCGVLQALCRVEGVLPGETGVRVRITDDTPPQASAADPGNGSLEPGGKMPAQQGSACQKQSRLPALCGKWVGSPAEAVYLALVFAVSVLLLAGNTYHAFIYARF
ncbi:MAG: MBOAT family O-acyltransferase [Lachnospiraceae bacterium]|nr:MBOAT family O-acyltransferase [Lachnospiraceae bacterium]